MPTEVRIKETKNDDHTIIELDPSSSSHPNSAEIDLMNSQVSLID